MMEGQLHQLLRILDAEHSAFLRSLESLKDQQQRLMENRRNSTQSDQGKAECLKGQVADQERRRNEIVDIISRKLDLKSGHSTVGQLLDSLKKSKPGSLERLKKTIIDAYEKAEKQRKHNDRIIGQSLDIIKQTMDPYSQNRDRSASNNEAAGSRRPEATNRNRLVIEGRFAEVTGTEKQIDGPQGN